MHPVLGPSGARPDNLICMMEEDAAEGANLTTTETLKALSHPVRRDILKLLARRGHGRATDLARELGLKSNAVSFHLRVLGRAGLIEEDPDLARDGRDRVWKATRKPVNLDPRATYPQDQALTMGLIGQVMAELQILVSQVSEWISEEYTTFDAGGDGLARASVLSTHIAITHAQMEELQTKFSQLLFEAEDTANPEDPDVVRWEIAVIAGDQVVTDRKTSG